MNRYEPARWRHEAKVRKHVADLQLETPERLWQTYTTSPNGIADETTRIELHHFGCGHTRGDTFVYPPNEKILRRRRAEGPFITAGDANMSNWPNVINGAQGLEVKDALPRHVQPAATRDSGRAEAISPGVTPKAICSHCDQPAPGYDPLAEWRFEFIPLRGFLGFLLYTMRRVHCHPCRATLVEEDPCSGTPGNGGLPGRRRPTRFALRGTMFSMLSPDMPLGDGDTPIREVLRVVRGPNYQIPAYIEYEWQGPDVIAEVRKALEYRRAAISG